jgi:sec-independent protein translocase protein TatC
MAVVTRDQKEPVEDGQGANLTILEHLQELRRRMMIAGAALVVATIAAFYPLTYWVLDWLKRPAESRVENFELIFTQPLEFWTTFFRVSLMIGLAVAMPVIIYQLMAFISPGLTRNEKKWAYPIIGGASFMFIAGCLFAYFIELPPALNFLLGAQGDIATPLISVRSYVDFVTRLMIVTGFVFQTPLIVMALAKVGLVTSTKLLKWWRFAIVGAFVISAIVTPSIDPITQTLVAVPMIILYFAGIILAKMVEKTPIIPRY